MTTGRRAFLFALLNATALLFRAASAGAAVRQCGKVLDVNPQKQTAVIEMACMPTQIKVECEGDPRGLSEGDYIDFHFDKDELKWKHGKLRVTRVDFVL